MIVVIPCSGDGCKAVGEVDSDWLPRQCPRCGQWAIIGHGRRRRQCHDETHDWIRVRRGLCNHCDLTVTVLPPVCVPGALYALTARQQAMDRLSEGKSLEESAPDCRDGNRVAAASTVRRWAWLRLASLGIRTTRLWNLRLPTLLAWDLRAVLRILIPEVDTVP
jgi:hypothetical protein